MPYVSRTDLGDLIQKQVLTDLYETNKYTSVVMTLGQQIPVGTKETVFSIVATDPVAEFVDKTGTQASPTAGKYPAVAAVDAPDIGYKPVSKPTFTSAQLILEKIAVIVPLSDSVMEDCPSPEALEEMIRRKCEEAIARRFDKAALMGVNAPTTYGSGIVAQAEAAGNVVTVANTANAVAKLATLNEAMTILEDNGYEVTDIVGQTALKGIFRTAMTTDTNISVSPDMVTQRPSYQYFGIPLTTAAAFNGTDYLAALGDWSMVKWGIRNSFEVTESREAVITNEDGTTYNLFQQDMHAIRVVARLGYTVLHREGDYPLAVIKLTSAA